MMMSSCSNGHNSRTCLPSAADDSSSVAGDGGGGGGSGEILLFGVRVKVDPMRKSVSLNNLSQYEQPQQLSNYAADISAAVPTGYASADDAANYQSTASRERKRGVPWTEEEHKLFLLGLKKVGKGEWRGISRNFVKTRTPTQVASHAQKYFLRQSNLNRRRRRSSLFDITPDSVIATPMEEELVNEDNLICPVMPQQETPNISGFRVAPFPASVGPVLFPVEIENPLENLTLGNANQLNIASTVLIRPIPVLPMPNPPPPSAEVNLSQKLTIDNSLLSLNLSLSFNHQNQSSSGHSTFQVMPSFKNGDSVISVA